MASQSLFYEGSIPEVIHKSKQEKKLLVVFLKGGSGLMFAFGPPSAILRKTIRVLRIILLFDFVS